MEEAKEQPALLENKKHRFWELDFLRGICVLLMVFDHCMFTMGYLMPSTGAELGTNMWEGMYSFVNNVYWYGSLRSYAHVIVVCIFFLICGISCTLSRSNFKRGILCFLAGCAVTFVTVIADRVMPQDSEPIAIYFGVLHMLGIAMLLYGALDNLGLLIAKIGKSEQTKKITKIIGDYLTPTVGLIFLIIFFACFFQSLSYGELTTNIVIKDKSSSVLASIFIGVKPYDNNGEWIIGGSDYWPLLPWVAIVLIGGFIGRGLYHSKAKNYLAKLDGKWNKPICFVGRHALLIYVAHQVAIFVLCFIITLVVSWFA